MSFEPLKGKAFSYNDLPDVLSEVELSGDLTMEEMKDAKVMYFENDLVDAFEFLKQRIRSYGITGNRRQDNYVKAAILDYIEEAFPDIFNHKTQDTDECQP